MPDPMVDKIAKLLAKAEHATTSHEAQAFTAKAADLMAAHGIKAHMIAAAQAKAGSTSRRVVTEKFTMSRPFQHQRKDLMVQIGGALNLKPVIHRDTTDMPGKYRETIKVSLFGSEADISRARVLWTSTMLQAFSVMAYELHGAKSSAKQSWLQGWAAAIGELVRAAEQQAATAYDQEHKLEAGAVGTALVLAGWDEKVSEFRASLHPNLGFARSRSTSGNRFGDGRQAGLRADIGQRAGIGGQRAIA